MPMVAWYILSNESYMKRVMSEVLPTVRRNRVSAGPNIVLTDAMAHTALLAQEDQPTLSLVWGPCSAGLDKPSHT